MAKASLQFHTDNEKEKNNLYKLAVEEFDKLKKRYDAILSGSVNVDTGVKDENTYNSKVTVILKTKIKDFVGKKINKNSYSAIRQSFEAAERQIRKTLDKISHPWEKNKK